MLNLECSYGYAHMTTLMRLVAIQVTDDALFAINDLHLLAFRQPDALLKGNHHPLYTLAMVLFEHSLESSFWRICSEEHKSAALTSSTENVGKPWIALSSIHFCNVILSNFGANIIKKILALYCFCLKSLYFIEFYLQSPPVTRWNDFLAWAVVISVSSLSPLQPISCPNIRTRSWLQGDGVQFLVLSQDLTTRRSKYLFGRKLAIWVKTYCPKCIYIPNLIWMQRYAFQKCDKVFGTYYVVHERVIFQFNGI